MHPAIEEMAACSSACKAGNLAEKQRRSPASRGAGHSKHLAQAQDWAVLAYR